MAFVKAVVTSYVNETAPDGTPTAIVITGEITDDAIPSTWVGAYRIEGAELAALPAANPATDGTPADARFQAIQTLTAAFVKRTHQAWSDAVIGQPLVSAKPAEVVALLPAITVLPA